MGLDLGESETMHRRLESNYIKGGSDRGLD